MISFLKLFSIMSMFTLLSFSSCMKNNASSLVVIKNLEVKDEYHIKLSNVGIDDLDLQKIKHFHEVAYLDVSHNKKLKTIKPLLKLRLTNLDISNTGVNDLSGIEQFEFLRHLKIGNSNIKDLSPLEGLYLNSLSITGLKLDSFESLLKINNLFELDCSKTNLSYLGILRNCRHLDSLDISNTKIKNLDGISKLEALRHLNTKGTNLQSIDSLVNIPYLEEVTLPTGLKDLSVILKLKSLKTLTLSSSYKNNDHIKELSQQNKKIIVNWTD